MDGSSAATKDHKDGLPFDVSRHDVSLRPPDYQEGFKAGYKQESTDLLRAPGLLAGEADAKAGLAFDGERRMDHVASASERAQREFRKGYVQGYRKRGQFNRACIETYFLPEEDSEAATWVGRGAAASYLKAFRDTDPLHWSKLPFCKNSVLTQTQAASFRQGLSERLAEKAKFAERERARKDRVTDDDIAVWVVLGVLGCGLLFLVVMLTRKKAKAPMARPVAAASAAPTPERPRHQHR